ncbi:rab11 family-interacting protein 4 isoform X1 [Harmonia axyridis]|uniref:rab11 family-interacting protein 4 isoform X1 n=1 Tax=Harmonia axyridis TaxID=115357 RepID=UPI001E2795D2|nr:rab11 family-interacting protein 4 isoform X1 [Harmonia axyridis]XP_045463161.1 rab11 family-interacting protein 4 isoform X1 [Harmonia axyridis]
MSPITTPGALMSGDTQSPSFSPQRRLEDAKSQFSSLSDAESYEWNGEQDADADSGISTERNLGGNLNGRNRNISRNTWQRTSLRRSTPSHVKRQLGSNALASQLYRSYSFNSSGRSSNCDPADDIYSDASLEEDVHEIHHKVRLLEEQIGVLTESSQQNDEKYTKARVDNATLSTRILMLEEQIRDMEIRYEERLQEEQRRSKDLISRLEREKQLQLENANIRLQSRIEENTNLKEELARHRIAIQKIENERNNLLEQVKELTEEINSTKAEASTSKETEKSLHRQCEAKNQLIEELSQEVEKLRAKTRTPALPTTSVDTLRLEELHEELSALRDKNLKLEEVNEELQASLLHAGLEQGILLTQHENSLAAELEAMSQEEICTIADNDDFYKIQRALKEQQDVNAQLKTYIDGILLNIVENYPQLLEVKQKS